MVTREGQEAEPGYGVLSNGPDQWGTQPHPKNGLIEDNRYLSTTVFCGAQAAISSRMGSLVEALQDLVQSTWRWNNKKDHDKWLSTFQFDF